MILKQTLVILSAALCLFYWTIKVQWILQYL